MSDDKSKELETAAEQLNHNSADHVTEEMLEHMQDGQVDDSKDGNNDSLEGDLLGDLLDEVADSEDSDHEEVVESNDEAISIEARNNETTPNEEEKEGSNFLLVAVIVTLLVGGIAYFSSKSDTPNEPVAVSQPDAITTAEIERQTTSPVPGIKPAEEPQPATKEVHEQVIEKNIQPVSAENKERIATTAMKPLLSDSNENSEPAVEAETSSEKLSSVVSDRLEFDPVTRKVISLQTGKTTFVWAINLISLSTHASADRLINVLQSEGTETELIQVNIGDKTYYRIRVPNFSSVEAADRAHVRFKENPLFSGSWVSRYRK